MAYTTGEGARASVESVQKSLGTARKVNRRKRKKAERRTPSDPRYIAKMADVYARDLVAKDRNSRTLGYDEETGAPYDGHYGQLAKGMGVSATFSSGGTSDAADREAYARSLERQGVRLWKP